MTTIRFFGHSDDLLEARWHSGEIKAVGQVDEMDANVGGWLVTYPSGEQFAVLGEYTDRGHWQMTFAFPPGTDEEGDGVAVPQEIDAAVGQMPGRFSTFLDVLVPDGTRLEQLPNEARGAS